MSVICWYYCKSSHAALKVHVILEISVCDPCWLAAKKLYKTHVYTFVLRDNLALFQPPKGPNSRNAGLEHHEWCVELRWREVEARCWSLHPLNLSM
jgi:hypothetical protein